MTRSRRPQGKPAGPQQRAAPPVSASAGRPPERPRSRDDAVDEHVRRVIERAPLLTPEQVDVLRDLLRLPSGRRKQGVDAA